MWKNALYLLILISLSACSTFNLSNFKHKYVPISYEESERLNGVYLNRSDTFRYSPTLFGKVSKNDIPALDSLKVVVHVEDKKTLKFVLTSGTAPLDVATLRGKFKRGMFNVHKWDARMVVGPLIWFLGEERLYFGVNEENNLCLFSSGGGGVAMLIAFPIMAGGGGPRTFEFERMENTPLEK